MKPPKTTTFTMFTKDKLFSVENYVTLNKYHLKTVRHCQKTKDIMQ